MRTILALVAFMTLACGGESIRDRDKKLIADSEALVTRYQNTGLSREQYIIELQTLRKRETALFAEARETKFDDINDENYWRRSRLKDPSILAQELEKLGVTP